MAEVGQVAHATVVRVMPYGAIVRLEDGTVGLVHISEFDHCFVDDVYAYCSEGARVVVRVLRRKNDGRWEFSMKRVGRGAPDPDSGGQAAENFGGGQPMYDSAMPTQPAPRAARSSAQREAFDEKLREFLSDSSERLEDMRRHHDHRLHGKRR